MTRRSRSAWRRAAGAAACGSVAPRLVWTHTRRSGAGRTGETREDAPGAAARRLAGNDGVTGCGGAQARQTSFSWVSHSPVKLFLKKGSSGKRGEALG